MQELRHKPVPQIVFPIKGKTLSALQLHIREVRKCFEGSPYHDANEPLANRFNRWHWHNLAEVRKLHYSLPMIKFASKLFGRPLKPSYSFVSMYGPEGVCPLHVDRPQCQFTIDLLLNSNGDWPIYVEDLPFILKPGDALAYSGTGQRHFRKPMAEDSNGCTFADLAFFHFVPLEWEGDLK